MKKKPVIVLAVAIVSLIIIIIGINIISDDKSNNQLIENTQTESEIVNTTETETETEETTGEAGNGEYIYNEDTGEYEGESGYDYGMTWNEMEEDSKDGVAGGEVHYNDDNTTYVIWTVGEHAGNRYEVGDRLPTGNIYTGITEEDSIKYWNMMDELYGNN